MYHEYNREESREVNQKLFVNLHKEIFEKKVFTPEKFIEDHEKYAICNNIVRGSTGFIIK